MKKIIAVVCMLFAVISVNAAMVVTNLTSVPADNIVISQATSDMDIATRYFSGANYRSMVQTFTWNSADNLGAVGFYVRSTAGSGSQTYWLAIQEVSVSTIGANLSNVVQRTVYSNSFAVTQLIATSESWLHFDLGEKVVLENGKIYAILVGPDIASGNIDGDLTINFGATMSNPYLGGGGSQPNTMVNGMPFADGSSFLIPATTRDMAFYAAAYSAPATVRLLLISVLPNLKESTVVYPYRNLSGTGYSHTKKEI